ncbi:MAG: pilus assembly protein PilM [Salinisphaera sp.]|nr:pilus assembly protein PilM [Salinisphaera sp.]
MHLMNAFAGGSGPGLMALDISSTRIKLLALSGGPASFQIDSYASEALPAGAVQDHRIVDPELLGQCIRRVVKRSGCRRKQAAVAVAGASVISKVIELPATLRESEIEDQIEDEADAYIPYPVNEVSLDFQQLGPAESDADMQQVLLAACRRETVEDRVAAAALAGIDVQVVDVEAYALQNACALLLAQLPGGGRQQTVAVADVGASATALHVLHDGETVYTREQGFGGNQLIEEIQRHYQLQSPQQALEQLQGNRLDAAFTEGALPRFIARIAQQVDRSLQYFFTQASQYPSIDTLFVAGGCALLAGMVDGIGRELEVDTRLANPLAGIRAAGAARRNRVEAEGPALMVATGLAMRSGS